MINGRKTGVIWADVKKMDRLLRNFHYELRAKTEREFGIALSTIIGNSKRSKFKNSVYSEIDKTTKVPSVYCFGKKNRPDLAINHNGIALEYKFCNSDGLSKAIGQGMIYRMKYKFVFLVLILKSDPRTKKFYLDYCNGLEEQELLSQLLTELAKSSRIYTYIIPSFNSADSKFKQFKAFF